MTGEQMRLWRQLEAARDVEAVATVYWTTTCFGSVDEWARAGAAWQAAARAVDEARRAFEAADGPLMLAA